MSSVIVAKNAEDRLKPLVKLVINNGNAKKPTELIFYVFITTIIYKVYI